MLFVHGYGCDQHMWRLVAPAFEDDHKIVLMDLLGFGNSQVSAYDWAKYGSLHGHAADVIEVIDALGLSDVVLVGHSVSAMIGVLAANQEPGRISRLVMIAPSPCYLNDGDYHGGFSRADLDGLLDFLDSNFFGWSAKMAPAIMGLPDRPELATELADSFCSTDPEIAKHFGRVTFLSDHRGDVAELSVPSLVLQCSNDLVAPVEVGKWLHKTIPRSQLVLMEATGHCPHPSAPAETIDAIKSFLP